MSLPYEIMDTPSEKEYDDITKLASIICDTPISTITFFDESRQFFKSHYGLEMSEAPIEDFFSRHVIDNPDEFMIIPNAQKDDRFKDKPSVVDNPKIVFYAGYPVNNDKGVPFATFSIIDQKIRELTDTQKEAIKSLANQVEQLLELRRTKLVLEAKNASVAQEKIILDAIIEGTDAGTWEWDIATDEVFINAKWFQLLGYTSKPYEVFTMQNWRELVFPDDLIQFEVGLTNCLSGISEKFHLKYRVKHLQGNWIWVENRGKVVDKSKNGKPLKMFGIHLNIDKERMQENQFLAIADSVPGVVFRSEMAKDGTANLSYVSNGFLDLWGVSSEIAMEDNNRIWSLILDEDLPKVQKSIEQSATHMTNWVSEWRIKQANGAVKWHKGIGKPVKNLDGGIYWDSIILDITEEKLISENLAKRNELIEAILENLPIGIAVNDMVTGEAKIVNHKFSEIYGWPYEELLDINTFFEKIYPDKAYKEEIKNRIISDIQSDDLEQMSWKGIIVTGKNGE